MKLAIGIVLVLLLIGCVAGCSLFSRGAYDSAPYEVTLKDGDFEIRQYKTLNVVSTTMKGDNQDDDGAFMRLFRYISKNNEGEQKIAMTTPVFSEMEGDTKKMHFVLPEDLSNAPAPKSDQVSLGELMGTTLAIYRYSGSWKQEKIDEAEATLLEWMKENNLTPSGSPIWAGYDPPFTPPFLRRNEVLIPISQ